MFPAKSIISFNLTTVAKLIINVIQEATQELYVLA